MTLRSFIRTVRRPRPFPTVSSEFIAFSGLFFLSGSEIGLSVLVFSSIIALSVLITVRSLPRFFNARPGKEAMYGHGDETANRLFFENHPLPQWVVDSESFSCLAVNQAAVDQYGYGRDEFIGMKFTLLHPPEQWPALSDYFRSLAASKSRGSGPGESGEWEHRKKDGASVKTDLSGAQVVFRGKPAWLVVANEASLALMSLSALRQSETNLRLLAEGIHGMLWIANPDLTELTYTSRGYEQIWGRTLESLYAAPLSRIDAVHPEDRDRVLKAVAEQKRTGTFAEEYRIIRPDGTIRWVRDKSSLSPVGPSARKQVVGFAQDITEEVGARESLRAQVQHQAVLADLSQRALAGLDASALIDKAVSGATHVLGVDFCEVMELLPDGSGLLLRTSSDRGQPAEASTALGSPESSQEAYTLSVSEPVAVENYSAEKRFNAAPRLRNRGVVSGLSVVIPGTNRPFGVLTAYTCRKRTFGDADRDFLQIVANILATAVDRKRAEETIQAQAYFDPLTGLHNRTLLEDHLTLALAHATRKNQPLAVMFLDLDRFKIINDTLGHHSGDVLLKEVAQRLMRSVRDCDTVARMGGDEFAILLSEIHGVNDVTPVAERILDALKPPFQLEAREVHVSGSIGIAHFPACGKDAETLLRHADTALYRAKERGGNTFRHYTAAMSKEGIGDLALESQLRRAVEHGEFALHFQPQVNLESGQIIGFEALVRWRRSDGHLVLPSVFIPMAEETGLILPIGEWVIRAACVQGRLWQDQGFTSLRVAVNLSARQFMQEDLVERIGRVLAKTKFRPEQLEIELTESILMRREETILEMLRQLSEMGIQLSVDDFGTGYSSLGYLKRFPIRKLKIDQSFVRDVSTDPNNAVIAQTIVNMAHSMNLKAIAEGVETEEQLAFVRSIQCDEIQGFLFSRPLPAEEATELLTQGRRL